ncbi:MAG: phenylalanine--tRNA ligase subunit beta [OM182 bacterium MED-G28]|uniref:Phenylalanine--tRNA ligase beta subunit n=1 Tax=OM182 bacterium MED-G28 TaxID=1986256 RepID=A0A2A5WCV6_9GAMM|nr:MAG: phenylalanine--tRNA ligase subunit beta [OM182 bacterium MED-G28]
MKFSELWLKELIDHQMSSENLIESLTMAGLEVDGIVPVAREFSDVIVVEVTKVQPHPDANKLSLCEVSDGAHSFQVVCGAPNVKVGMKAPFAKVGARIDIPDEDKPFVIKAAKLRGIESKGMLCSAEELGLEEKSEGLLSLPEYMTVGEDIRKELKLEDKTIELDLTPNRGDCLGMIGLARELGVLTRTNVNEHEISSARVGISEELPITISAKDSCPRYLGRVIKNINVNSVSPYWLQEKLRRSGLRSVDPIVDVTNFVLIELGQPMHAFDFNELIGGIDVRMARDGEKLTLLDGKEIVLNPEVLVIADHEKPVAMAGIMGGLKTAVTDSTTDVYLECAYFAPLAIAGKARLFGMQTDASHRYERGVDYTLQSRAMERATELLLEIAGGTPGPITETVGNLPKAITVELRFQSVKEVLGIEMDSDEIQDIISRLGFSVIKRSEQVLTVEVPPYRFDVSIEADLIEELARIYGYNNIPETRGVGRQLLSATIEAQIPLRRIRYQLVALGYQEVVTYAFIAPTLSKVVLGSDGSTIALQNPISEDMSLMRSSLLPGLISAYQYNSNRQRDRLRLFETGLVFSQSGNEIQQTSMIGGLISGQRNPVNWANKKEVGDFYDIKGDVEVLLSLKGQSMGIRFVAAERPGFHPGQCARIQDMQGNEIGHLGALHPAAAIQLGIESTVYIFELLQAAVESSEIPRATELSKYPEVSRDLAIVIDEFVSSSAILAMVEDKAGEFLVGSRIFDVYQGDAVSKGKKSIALGLTWQHPSRTLSDEEINTIISSCIKELEEQFNANLRN